MPSDWNTENHYFYEIINRTGKDAYIQFAINSKNITDEFRATCEKINQIYPAKMGKEDWVYRVPFRTKSVTIDDELSEEFIFDNLNKCMDEILAFEKDLLEKLNEK